MSKFLGVSLLSTFKGINIINIYRLVSHVGGWNGLAQYEIRGNEIYRTVSHVDGWNGLAQYEIRA